jgi:hypothetical protein
VFNAERSPFSAPDFPLLSGTLLKPFNRVVITVTLNGSPQVLMDGFITNQELGHHSSSGATTLTITGEDVSVAMDLYEQSMEYPSMGDEIIAGLIMAKYFGVIGLRPQIHPTVTSILDDLGALGRVPQQISTDRQYLQQLATPHGFVFYVKPGPGHLVNTAYWGPPAWGAPPQAPLTVDMGPATNVESIDFNYNALAPNLVRGWVQETWTGLDLPLITSAPDLDPPLSQQSGVPDFDFSTLLNELVPFLMPPPFVRMVNFQQTWEGYMLAMLDAQSQIDTSVRKTVVGQGELDAQRYGSILRARGVVGVRGMGYSYDGYYYVQKVTHSISRGKYKQSFTLNREGIGSTANSLGG